MPRGSTYYRNEQRPDLAAPPPHQRVGPGPATVMERHGRVEGNTTEVTLGDALGAVFIASGRPDLWHLTARTNGALAVLDDLDGRESDPIPVLAGQTVKVRLPRRRVQARNLVAGQNAEFIATALYAQPGEAFDASS